MSDTGINTNPEPSVPPTVVATTMNAVPTIPLQTAQPASRTFTEQDLEAARRQERDKLYSDLQGLQETVKTLKDARDAEEAAKAEAERLRQAEEARRSQEEMSAKDLLAQQQTEWSARFDALKQDLALAEAQTMQERRLAELNNYKAQAIAARGDDIHPTLRDYVGGNSPEEINASIEAAVSKTAQLLAEVQEYVQQQVPFSAPPAPQSPFGALGPRTPATSGAPAYDHGALAGTATQNFTAEQIKNMSPGEYTQYRNQLLAAQSQLVAQHGPYGNR